MKTALLVESGKTPTEAISNPLLSHGFTVEMVRSDSDLCTRLRGEPTDLVFVDIGMACFEPDKGAEVVRNIKACWPEARFITMTGKNSRELEMSVRREGILCYLLKPVEQNIVDELLTFLVTREQPRDGPSGDDEGRAA